jgi:hypothetical protein
MTVKVSLDRRGVWGGGGEGEQQCHMDIVSLDMITWLTSGEGSGREIVSTWIVSKVVFVYVCVCVKEMSELLQGLSLYINKL